MKNNHKRMISVMLILCLLLSVMPLSGMAGVVFAEPPEDAEPVSTAPLEYDSRLDSAPEVEMPRSDFDDNQPVASEAPVAEDLYATVEPEAEEATAAPEPRIPEAPVDEPDTTPELSRETSDPKPIEEIAAETETESSSCLIVEAVDPDPAENSEPSPARTENDPVVENEKNNMIHTIKDDEGREYFEFTSGTRGTVRVYKDSYINIYFNGKGKHGNFPWMSTAYLELANNLLYSPGQWIYCIDYAGNLSGGNTTTYSDLNQAPTWRSLSAAKKLGIILALSYGAQNGSHNNHFAHVATQTIIWEYQIGGRTSASTYSSNASSPISYASDGNGNYTSSAYKTKIDTEYARILNAIKNAEYTPSFTESSYTLSGVGSEYAHDFTDSVGALSKGVWKVASCPSELSAAIVNGKLRVYATAGFSGTKTITLKRSLYRPSGSQVYVCQAGTQWAICGVPEDTSTVTITISVNQTHVVSLKKTASASSTVMECIRDNPLYTLERAVYEIHKGSKDGPLMETLTTNANGEAVGTVKYDIGTVLYAVEVTAPSGYKLSTSATSLTVSSGDNTFHVSDEPTFDPSRMKINKTGVSDEQIAGAVFKVEFYAWTWAKPENLLRTWFFKSDVNGRIIFDDEHLAEEYSSDPLYKPFGTNPHFPLGCIVVQEVKAADGYILPTENDGKVWLFVKQLENGGNAESYWGNGSGDPLTEQNPRGIYRIENDADPSSLTAVNTPEHPIISTFAAAADGGKVVDALSSIAIRDTVSYQYLEPGTSYIMEATIMVKDGGESSPYQENGTVYTVEKEFVPSERNGDVVLDLIIDASGLAGKDFVLYERCYELNGSDRNLVAEHCDINDENQTIHVNIITIGTTAANAETGGKAFLPFEDVELTDTVSYSGVIPGHSYIFFGTLIDKTIGTELVDADGLPITSYAEFTAEEESGTVTVTFHFNASTLHGQELVVFESLVSAEAQDIVLAEHKDLDDENQTVEITTPELHTTATNKDTSGKILLPSESVSVVDEVAYTGLIPGYTYTVSGVLMDKQAGEPVMLDGNPITAEASFTPEESSGVVMVTFVFNAIGLEDHDLVVFESLYYAETEIADHEDIEDEDQTVHVANPEIGTTATFEDGGKIANIADQLTIIDVVHYENLIPGISYMLMGTLMDKSTASALLDENGNPYVVTKTFTPDESSGTLEVEFIVAAMNLDGKSLVVFEAIYTEADYEADREPIAVHEDIEDEGQTVHFANPEIGTKATNEYGGNTINPAPKQTVVDRVDYKDLIPGKTYTVTGTLMLKTENGEEKELLVNGEPVTASVEFVPETTDGSVEVTFVFDATGLEETRIVVFEELYYTGYQIAVHADIDDEDQTIVVPNPLIHTSASNKEDGGKIIDPTVNVIIVDTVTYEGLVPGTTYVMRGVLMGRKVDENGNVIAFAVEVNGKSITAEKAFIPTESCGSIEMEFTLNASALRGSDIVVFESLYIQGETGSLVEHRDIDDKEQTVTFTNPELHTTAVVNGQKEADAAKSLTVVDFVKYTGLIVGKQYTVSGVLMDKATGKPLMVNGKEITAQVTFTAETSDGSIEMRFTFDASALGGKELVVFEDLSHNGSTIATHADLNDKNQTVTIHPPKSPELPKTGDYGLWKYGAFGTALIAAAFAVLFMALHKRKKKK